MNRRLYYPIFTIIALLIIYFIVQPYLYQFYESNRILEEEFRLYYFSVNLFVTAGIAVIILFEGRFNGGIKGVSGLLILTALMEFIRYRSFPVLSIQTSVISMFSGILIFAFGLVSIKKAIFKKGAGIFFILLGGVYMLRFPMFIDVLFFYYKKYAINISTADGYYLGSLYFNYFIIFLQLIALNAVILENIAMSRYPESKTTKHY
jgi:hypothetical protein